MRTLKATLGIRDVALPRLILRNFNDFVLIDSGIPYLNFQADLVAFTHYAQTHRALQPSEIFPRKIVNDTVPKGHL